MLLQTRLSATYWIAFIALCFVISELHEQAHIQTGYLLLGAYGPRNFNTWQTAAGGSGATWASAGGPLFSYLVVWTGVLLLFGRGEVYRRWGLALVFAALPFAHIFTGLMGSGDERVLADAWLPGWKPVQRPLLAAWNLLVYGVPIVLAARRLRATKRWMVLTALMIGPMIVEFVIGHQLYNKWLDAGFGASVPWGGTPVLVQVHFAVALLVLLLLRRTIGQGSPLSRPSLRLSSSF